MEAWIYWGVAGVVHLDPSHRGVHGQPPALVKLVLNVGLKTCMGPNKVGPAIHLGQKMLVQLKCKGL